MTGGRSDGGRAAPASAELELEPPGCAVAVLGRGRLARGDWTAWVAVDDVGVGGNSWTRGWGVFGSLVYCRNRSY